MPSGPESAPLSFLGLPLIARDIIFKELLSINSTKTEKPYPDTCRSSVRYNWNLHPAILATNRQIHEEA